METISNQELRIAVSPHGAEMQSLKTVRMGREWLWQGDAAYWERRSPILFPAVGGLWNATCRVAGRCLKLSKHGFMRDKTWRIVERTSQQLTFEYEDCGEDREAFPWPYVVRVSYVLEGRSVDVKFEVENRATETMFFQMGGHPGFSLPDFVDPTDGPDGFLRLTGRADHVLRAGEQGCTEPQTYAFPQTQEGLVPLCVETFANEALIFEGHQLTAVTVLNKAKQPLVAVRSTAPVWLCWSPQGVHAPFVCIEPWYGLCDPIGFEGDVSERPFINRLEAGGTWRGGYAIDILA